MKNIPIFLIKLYQKVFYFRQRHCVFYPTCSDYAVQALKKYGFLKGVYLSIRRILKCHPWQENKVDNLK